MRFLLACIRHAWDGHVGGAFPDEMLEVLTNLFENDKDIDLPTFRAHIDRFQAVFDREKAIALADKAAIPRATMLYLVGALSGWFFHAFTAVTDDPTTEWGRYSIGNSRWLPFWHVLDGCMSVGGEPERAWQEQIFGHFASM